MDTKLLVEQYLANGGTITKLPDGKAEGGMDGASTYDMTKSKTFIIEEEVVNYMAGGKRLFKTPQELAKEDRQ